MEHAALISLSATQARYEIARGTLSAEDYATACLERIEALEPDVRAFAQLDRDYALAQARSLDQRRRNGLPMGPLHGIPVAIKDIFDTEDYPTEYGSALFAGRRARQDAAAVARLRQAGAIIIGKTVTTEFAYYAPGKTRNPHNLSHTPGGSSSGSAAAVAAGMVPLALGSQTNGSVIRPASFCGVFGAKPSHGLISRAGVLQLSRILDHVGVFARTLDDIALLLDVLAGHDPEDPDTRPVAHADFTTVLAESPPLPPRFATVRTPVWDTASPEMQAAFADIVARLGDAATNVELPAAFAGAWDAHRKIMSADMAHRLGAVVDRGNQDASSEKLRTLLSEGREVTAVDYLASCDMPRLLAPGLAAIFEYCDAIITPASAGPAPQDLGSTGDPAFCTLWTLLGLPALNLPILQSASGMPMGLQIVGMPRDDARLLRTARALLDRLAGNTHEHGRKTRA